MPRNFANFFISKWKLLKGIKILDEGRKKPKNSRDIFAAISLEILSCPFPNWSVSACPPNFLPLFKRKTATNSQIKIRYFTLYFCEQTDFDGLEWHSSPILWLRDLSKDHQRLLLQCSAIILQQWLSLNHSRVGETLEYYGISNDWPLSKHQTFFTQTFSASTNMAYRSCLTHEFFCIGGRVNGQSFGHVQNGKRSTLLC